MNMTEHEEMLAREVVMRDPQFSLRLLWGRQVLLFVLLAAGIVMSCVLLLRALRGLQPRGGAAPLRGPSIKNNMSNLCPGAP